MRKLSRITAVLSAGLVTAVCAAPAPATTVTIRPFTDRGVDHAWNVTVEVTSPANGADVTGDTVTVRGRAYVDDFDTTTSVDSGFGVFDRECWTSAADPPVTYCVFLKRVTLRLNEGAFAAVALDPVGNFSATLSGLRDGINRIDANAAWGTTHASHGIEIEEFARAGVVSTTSTALRRIPTWLDAEPVLLRVDSLDVTSVGTVIPDLVARLWIPNVPKTPGVPGATVEFLSGGRLIGRTTTDPGGVARLSRAVVSGLTGLGYTARFAGNEFYRPSSDFGPIVRVLGTDLL